MSTIREIAVSVAREMRRVPGLGRAYEATDPLRRARLLVRSKLIDTGFYAGQVGLDSISETDAASHYVNWGHWAGLTINPLLDDRALREGLRQSGRPIAYEYLRHRAWGIRTSPLWDSTAYLADNPQSVDHPAGPIGHLWDRVRHDADVLLPTSEGPLPWSEYAALQTRAIGEWGESDKARRARRLSRTFHGVDSLGEWPENQLEPLVSVILATWNRSGQLRDSVESVLRQTWRNLELLIMDDGSWDDTPAIAGILSNQDERVTYLSRDHAGVSAARNAGLSAAKGEFVAFLDSDNVWEPAFLQNMVIYMSSHRAVAAYATLEMDNGDRRLFREVEVTREILAQGNVIDLNTLVVDREVLLGVGGFDESLERAVDYDLILKLAANHSLHHVPVLGAVYRNYDDAHDRISTSKPFGWNTLVRQKHLIDWDALSTRPLENGSSIVIAISRDDPSLAEKLAVAEHLIASPENEVLLAMIVPTPSDWVSVTALTDRNDRIHATLFPLPQPLAQVVTEMLVLATRNRFAFIEPSTTFSADSVTALVSRVDPAVHRAVAPLLVYGDGTIVTVGAGFPRRSAAPVDMLSRHPQEDARALGDEIVVPALSGRTFALPTRDLESVRGLNPLLFNEFELPALGVALTQAYGSYESVTCSGIRFRRVDVKSDFERLDPKGNLSVVRALTRDIEPTDFGACYSPLDLKVPHFRSVAAHERSQEGGGLIVADGEDTEIPILETGRSGPLHHLQPVVVRHRRLVQIGGRRVPRLRWAIRIASPAWPIGGDWGDTHFARSLARALESLGQEVVIDHHEIERRATSYLDDVVLVLRGLDRVQPDSAAVSMLWVISHPDLVTKDEVQRFDHVFAASQSWARAMSDRWGGLVEPLLQCTDPTLFRPRGARRTKDVVFVGKSRGVARPAVVYPLRAGVPVQVYGGEWAGIIPPESVRASYVPNADLSSIYETASIVLNDHWQDMRRDGFLSNRLFDVVAAGGRVLSDAVEGIPEVFGDAVATYRDNAELVELVTSDLDSLFPADAELEHIASKVRAEHSFEARAATLLQAALKSLGLD